MEFFTEFNVYNFRKRFQNTRCCTGYDILGSRWVFARIDFNDDYFKER